MAYPLFSTLGGTVKYNDNVTLFDGYVLLLLALPTGYNCATISNQLIPQRIADHVKVRIQNGAYDGTVHIYQNASIQPPNTKYVAYFYDNEDKQLGSTSLFTVSTSPYVITVPSMTVPAAPVTPPTP